MPELLFYNPEQDDPSMKPISDDWWKHLLRVHDGFPPHPRSWYRMPACPDWGPRSISRYEDIHSITTQEVCMEEKFGLRIDPVAVANEIATVQERDLSLSRHMAAIAFAGMNPNDVEHVTDGGEQHHPVEIDEE